jgi:hypothetical protein
VEVNRIGRLIGECTARIALEAAEVFASTIVLDAHNQALAAESHLHGLAAVAAEIAARDGGDTSTWRQVEMRIRTALIPEDGQTAPNT